MRSADAQDLSALHLTGCLHFTQRLSTKVGRLQPPEDQLFGSVEPLVLLAVACKVDLLLARREVVNVWDQTPRSD